MPTGKNLKNSLKSRFFVSIAFIGSLFAACAIMLFAWGEEVDNVLFPAAATVFGVWLAIAAGVAIWNVYFKVIKPYEELDEFTTRLLHGEYPLPIHRTERQSYLADLSRSLVLLRDRQQNLNARLQDCLQRENELRRQSELYSELKSRVLAAAIPDLRLPLNAIGGYLYLLNSNPGSGHCPEWVRAIEYSLLECERQLKTLLEIGQMTTRREQGTGLSSFKTAAFMRETSQLSAHFAKERNVALVNCYSASSPQAIHSDRRLLEQLISILLRTSLGVSPPGGTVEFSCASADHAIELRVRTGGGDDRFRRLPELLRNYHAGELPEVPPEHEKLALGLLFVEAQAALVNGTLQIDTDDRSRLEFTLRLPGDIPESRGGSGKFFGTASNESAAAPAVPPGRVPLCPRRLLVMEKDRDVLAILRALCPLTEIVVIDSVRGREPDPSFDSILLNVSVSLSDEELSQVISYLEKAAELEVPVIILQDDDSPRLARYLAFPAAGRKFIKPFDFKELRRCLIDLGIRPAAP